jgi:hypothetical protein
MNDHTFDGRPGHSAPGGSKAGQALQPEHAFVVQLRSGPARSRRRLQGRVEHVVSGEVLRFDTTAELVDFLTRLLDAPRRGSR